MASASEAPIQPTHRRRPDTSEPWRYTCIECGSHVLNARTKKSVFCETCHTSLLYIHDKRRGVRQFAASVIEGARSNT